MLLHSSLQKTKKIPPASVGPKLLPPPRSTQGGNSITIHSLVFLLCISILLTRPVRILSIPQAKFASLNPKHEERRSRGNFGARLSRSLSAVFSLSALPSKCPSALPPSCKSQVHARAPFARALVHGADAAVAPRSPWAPAQVAAPGPHAPGLGS